MLMYTEAMSMLQGASGETREACDRKQQEGDESSARRGEGGGGGRG
jgi:hypothetical protein